VLTIFLSLFGLAMIYNVSSIAALADFNNQYYYVTQQIRWLAIGLMSMGFFSFFHYRNLYYLAVPLLLGSIGLLLAVFLPGIGVTVSGASRWLNLGFTTLQPTEFVKLSLIIYLAAWFSHKEKRRVGSFLLLLCFVIGPVVLQPDLGSASIMVLLAIALYFFSGAPLWHFGALVPAIIGVLGVLAISAPYRLERVKTFLDPSSDPQGASYHVWQILIALGTGGWFGLGIGKSRQKYSYLPEVTTDSIFAVIGEEIGFIGSSVLLLVLLLVIINAAKIAHRASDQFGKLLASGIMVALALQMILNLVAIVSLLPLTGTPLPFISYGGSNLIVSCTMIGILVNIGRRGS
jgi:cell division protein FtsW